MPENENIRNSWGGEHWHLDKRVPVALILALVVQTCAVVFWASNMSARLEFAERSLARTEAASNKMETVEYRLKSLDDKTARIEAKLELFLDREPR